MGWLENLRRKPPELGGGLQSLLDQNLQWPTEEMLSSRALRDKELAAYKSLTGTMDHAFDLLDQMRAKDWLPSIQRRPGFIQAGDEYFRAVSNYYAENCCNHEVLNPTEEYLPLVPDRDRPALMAFVLVRKTEYLNSVAAIAKYHPEIAPFREPSDCLYRAYPFSEDLATETARGQGLFLLVAKELEYRHLATSLYASIQDRAKPFFDLTRKERINTEDAVRYFSH